MAEKQNSTKQHVLLNSIISLFVLAFSIFFLCKCCFNVFENPEAVNEYREAADVQLTEAFLNGDNPYLLSSLESVDEGGMPPVLYQYSFLNSAVSALVTLIIGGDAVVAHYIVALMAIIGSALIVFLLIMRCTDNIVFPITGAVLTLFCHWRAGYLSTTPNSLGIFLMLLTAYFAVSPSLKGRWKLILTALLSVLLFYTKLYFVTAAFGIFVYFFCYDKKTAWKYFGYCIALGAVSVVLIQLNWPLYFTYSIYFINGMGLNYVPNAFKVSVIQNSVTIGTVAASINVNLEAFSYVFEQFGYMIKTFVMLFAVLIYSLITAVIYKRRVNVSKDDVLSLAIILSITQGLCMLLLGRADGAYLSYYLQLWMPFVIISAMICADKYVVNEKLKGMTGILITFLIVVVSLYFGYKKLPIRVMDEEDKYNWKVARDYIEQYESNGEEKESVCYYAPELAYIAMEHGKRVYDNGHVAVASQNGLNRWNDDSFSQTVFPYAGKIAQLNIDYKNLVCDRIRNREYSLVTLDSAHCMGGDDFKNLLKESGYIKTDTLPLAAGNAVYDVEFWTLD